MARRAADYGFSTGPVVVDLKKVKERKDGIVAQSNHGVESWLRGMKNCSVYQGHARFESARTVRAADDVLEAEKIFINVGARASLPSIPGLDRVRYLTNSGMMEIDFLPPHLVILGGSYIALEFGQIYRRFGSEVTIIERGPRLVSREDADVSEAVRAILEAEGVRVITNAAFTEVVERAGQVSVRLKVSGEAREVTG